MSRSRRKKAPRRQRALLPAKFTVGTPVRVKPGITDPDYPDIPIGGWAGIVESIDRKASPPTYQIAWNARTLDQQHPVFQRRCERDDLDAEEMWLDENELELDPGDLAPIEQPTELIERPLQENDPDDRVRAVFGLGHDDPMPAVNAASLRHYHQYLTRNLTFPFTARFTEFAEDLVGIEISEVTAVALLDPAETDNEGLICQVVDGGMEGDVPLANLEVVGNRLDRTRVNDYARWFFNESPNASEIGSHLLSMRHARRARRPELQAAIRRPLTFVIPAAIYGAVLGAVLAIVEQTMVAAGVGALLLGAWGAWTGFRVDDADDSPIPFTRDRVRTAVLGGLFMGMIGALAGAAIVLVVAAYAGALIGALAGAVLASLLARRKMVLYRAILGAIAGALAGALLEAIWLDPSSALGGALIGVGIGAVGLPIAIWLIAMIESSNPLKRAGD